MSRQLPLDTGEYNRQTRGGALKAEGDLGQPVTGTPRPVIEQLILENVGHCNAWQERVP